MKTFAAVLLAGLALFGCSSQPSSDEQSMAADEARITTDPVTGERVTKDSLWTTEYDGKEYYFVSEESRERFRFNPKAYVKEEDRPRRTQRPVYPHDLQ